MSYETSARFKEQLGPSPPYQSHMEPVNPQSDDDKWKDKELEAKQRSLYPALYQDGLEHIQDRDAEKEVVFDEPQIPSQSWTREDDARRRQICGMGRVGFIVTALLTVLVILAIALGVGLGVGLKKKSASPPPSSGSNQQSTQYLIGGSLNSSYYSTSGVFNGTGIALASESFTKDLAEGTQGDAVIYFQSWDGYIRWIQLNAEGQWVGGSISETVAADARNNTPLSAVSYYSAGVSTWHVFYIDTDNYLRQRSNSNVTNVWVDGLLNDANLKANDQEQVGLQACWFGNDYGDSGYTHTPLPNSTPGAKFGDSSGINLWYAKDNTTFEQWGSRNGNETWEYGGQWPQFNGHAGVGCYSWGPGTVIYSMFVNLNNNVEFWWRDSNTNLTNSTTHPIGVWTKAAYEIPNVNPSTALGYTNYFYTQLEDNVITGYNISWAAENTTLTGEPFSVGDLPAFSGTRMSVSALPADGGGNNIVVFLQDMGNQITAYYRDLYAGPWTSASLPIP